MAAWHPRLHAKASQIFWKIWHWYDGRCKMSLGKISLDRLVTLKVRWVISHQCVCVFFGGDTSLHRFTFHWKCVQRCCHLSALDFLRMRPVIVFLSVNLGGMLGWMNWNLVFGIPYFSLWDQEVMGTSSRKHRFHWDRTGTYDKQTRLAWKHPKFNWNDQMYMKLRGIKTTQLIFSYQLLVYQRLISDKEGVWGWSIGGLDIQDAPFGTCGRLYWVR